MVRLNKNADDAIHETCMVCVYYPPNLPENAYSKNDWEMLQTKTCSFDYQPGDKECEVTRKTSCSIVDLSAMNEKLSNIKLNEG